MKKSVKVYICIYIYIYIYYTNLTQSRKNKSNFIFAKSIAYSLLKSKQHFSRFQFLISWFKIVRVKPLMFDTINVKILRFEHAEVQMRINDQNCLCLGEHCLFLLRYKGTKGDIGFSGRPGTEGPVGLHGSPGESGENGERGSQGMFVCIIKNCSNYCLN